MHNRSKLEDFSLSRGKSDWTGSVLAVPKQGLFPHCGNPI